MSTEVKSNIFQIVSIQIFKECIDEFLLNSKLIGLFRANGFTLKSFNIINNMCYYIMENENPVELTDILSSKICKTINTKKIEILEKYYIFQYYHDNTKDHVGNIILS